MRGNHEAFTIGGPDKLVQVAFDLVACFIWMDDPEIGRGVVRIGPQQRLIPLRGVCTLSSVALNLFTEYPCIIIDRLEMNMSHTHIYIYIYIDIHIYL